MTTRNARPFALTVFGVTGFSGKLIAKYLDDLAREGRLPQPERIRFAARSLAKMQALCAGTCSALKPALLEADVGDASSLERMARESEVVISCVGPYALYGEGVVQACVSHGTDYVDITGEAAWVASMEAKYGAEAQRTGALLCPFSGHDCVPSDVTAWLSEAQVTPEELAASHATLVVAARLPAKELRLSAGTIKSAVRLIASGAETPAVPPLPNARLTSGVSVLDEVPKELRGPLVIMPTQLLPDGLVMAKSHAARAGQGQGVFESCFAAVFPSRRAARMASVGTAILPSMLRLPFVPELVDRLARDVDPAPDRAAARRGYDMFGVLKLYPLGAAADAPPRKVVVTNVHAARDTYDMTAVYCAQIGLALADPNFRQSRCPAAGFHTPVSSIGGQELLDRCAPLLTAKVLSVTRPA